jgi:hypothetical protein
MSISTNSKTILARALATENLKVQHNPNCHTAMFDPNSRVLTLPVWENMSNELYDLFVGHEVGHALFTPPSHEESSGPWCADAERIGGNVHASYVQGLLNIVEDVRIERMIKDKYPGLRRDFHIGYNDLMDRDFFGVKGKDLNDFSFADRLNIHFKCGSVLNVPFTSEEQEIVDLISSNNTFEDVINTTERIFNYLNGKRQDENNNEPSGSVQVQLDQGNGTDTNSNVSVDVQVPAEKTEKNEIGNSKQQQNPQSSDKTSQTNGQPSPLGAGSGLASETLPPVITQKNFDENCTNNLINKRVHTVKTLTLPTPDLSKIILPWQKTSQTLCDHYNSHRSKHTFTGKAIAKIDSMFNELVQNTKPLINTLVKQFEMKKAADIQKRTSISRSGKIDADRIFKYKVSDDIFLRCAKIAEGKNHGLVMFVDWSSSMQIATSDVINQIIMLTQFCRRMNIPFDVYMFSSQYTVLNNHNNNNHNEYAKIDQWGKIDHNTFSKFKMNTSDYEREFEELALIHVLSSDMNSRQYNDTLRNFFCLGKMITYDRQIFDDNRSIARTIPPSFNQGNTPLDECVVCAMHIVPQFQSKHKIQIVNTIFLTDGETGRSPITCRNEGNGYTSHEQNYVYCPLNKKEYVCNHVTSTDLLLEIFKECTQSMTIGFFICPPRSTYNRYFEDIPELRKDNVDSFKKNGFFEAPKTKTSRYYNYEIRDYVNQTAKNHGYDRLFVLPCNVEIEDDLQDLDNLSSDATITKIRNTFTKAVSKRNASRSFLNRFADVIAVGTKR